MRYKIEYLTETTDEASVCAHTFSDSTILEIVAIEAWDGLAGRRDAEGFQIRDLHSAWEVVALETNDIRPR